MLKSATKLSNILVHVHALFLISMVFFFSNCSERPEEDASKNARLNLDKKHSGKEPQERFKIYIKETIDTDPDHGNELAAYFDEAIKIVNNSSESLVKDPKSEENPLYILLDAISKVSEAEGIQVKGSKMGKYLQIFELLHNKGFKLDPETLLKTVTLRATQFREEPIPSLYYPLVVLGGIRPETEVTYRHDALGTRGDVGVPIILWTMLSGNLNRELQMKMLDILTEPENEEARKQAHSINNSKTHNKVQDNKMTPVMFAARRASNAENDEEAASYYLEIFKFFLRDPEIKFMDLNQLSEINDISKLKDQPLLSFIIYNCLSKGVRVHDEWMEVLKQALESNDMKRKDGKKSKKENKEKYDRIDEYIKKYIQDNSKGPNEDFETSGLYNQEDLKKVKDMLSEYQQTLK